MIKKYFESMQSELLDEKISLEKLCLEKENRIKEIEQFIRLLEEKNDPNFESFTPREVNIRNKDKIKLLQEEKKGIRKELDIARHSLKENEINWSKLSEITRYVKEEELKKIVDKEKNEYQKDRGVEVLQYVSREKEKVKDILQKDLLNDISNIYHKMQLSLQLMDVDVNRSKIELRQLLPDMSNLVENIQNHINEIGIFEEDEKIETLFSRYIKVQANLYDKKMNYASNHIFECISNQKNAIYQLVIGVIEIIKKRVKYLNLITDVDDEKIIISMECEFENQEQALKYIQRLRDNEKIEIELYLLQAKIYYNTSDNLHFIIKIVI